MVEQQPGLSPQRAMPFHIEGKTHSAPLFPDRPFSSFPATLELGEGRQCLHHPYPHCSPDYLPCPYKGSQIDRKDQPPSIGRSVDRTSASRTHSSRYLFPLR